MASFDESIKQCIENIKSTKIPSEKKEILCNAIHGIIKETASTNENEAIQIFNDLLYTWFNDNSIIEEIIKLLHDDASFCFLHPIILDINNSTDIFIYQHIGKSNVEIAIFDKNKYNSQIANCTSNIIAIPVNFLFLNSAHANMLIINRSNKTIEHFEPHGVFLKNMEKQEAINKEIDKLILLLFGDEYAIVHPNDTCPKIQGIVSSVSKEWGGTCAVFSMVYAIKRLTHPEKSHIEISEEIDRMMKEQDPVMLISSITRILVNLLNIDMNNKTVGERQIESFRDNVQKKGDMYLIKMGSNQYYGEFIQGKREGYGIYSNFRNFERIVENGFSEIFVNFPQIKNVSKFLKFCKPYLQQNNFLKLQRKLTGKYFNRFTESTTCINLLRKIFTPISTEIQIEPIKLHIHCGKDCEFNIFVKKTDTISMIREYIYRTIKWTEQYEIMFFDDNIRDEDETVMDMYIHIKNNAFKLNMMFGDIDNKYIHCKTQDDTDIFLYVNERDTVSSVKELLRNINITPLTNFELIFKNQELNNDVLINTLDNHEIIYIVEYITINIFNNSNSETIRLDVKDLDTIETIKKKIQDNKGIPLEQQRLIFSGRELENLKTLQESNIGMNTTIYLIIRLKPIQIYIKQLSNETVAFMVTDSHTIANLKQQIQDNMGVLPKQQHLFFKSKELTNEKTLKESNVVQGSIINLLISKEGGCKKRKNATRKKEKRRARKTESKKNSKIEK
jgi:ubiquitin C